jgi:hypothetical protein
MDQEQEAWKLELRILCNKPEIIGRQIFQILIVTQGSWTGGLPVS